MNMAWFNILDNTSRANTARKECKEIEGSSENLLNKITSLSASINNTIACAETLFENSYKAFENALSEAYDAVVRIDELAKERELGSFDGDTSFAINNIDISKADTEGLSLGSLVVASSGGIAAVGAYTAVGIVGTASTGTAIGSLSGAAASNATLAWFGGGAIASGGGGMLAGTAVLGGIVAAPIFFVAADQANKYYVKKRNNLKQYLEELEQSYAALKEQKEHIDSVAVRIKKKVLLLEFISSRLHQNALVLNNIALERHSKNLEPAALVCIGNINHLKEKANIALSFPIVVDGELEERETLSIETEDVKIEFSKKCWEI